MYIMKYRKNTEKIQKKYRKTTKKYKKYIKIETY